MAESDAWLIALNSEIKRRQEDIKELNEKITNDELNEKDKLNEYKSSQTNTVDAIAHVRNDIDEISEWEFTIGTQETVDEHMADALTKLNEISTIINKSELTGEYWATDTMINDLAHYLSQIEDCIDSASLPGEDWNSKIQYIRDLKDFLSESLTPLARECYDTYYDYTSAREQLQADRAEKKKLTNEWEELTEQKDLHISQKQEKEKERKQEIEGILEDSSIGNYDAIGGTTKSTIKSRLGQELMALEGIHGQNPETGDGIGDGEAKSFLPQYTNRIFGAPFQLLDSVDERFEEINPNLGTEYLRNFILGSPILYIKPGLPLYTGDTDMNSIETAIGNIYMKITGDQDINIITAIQQQMMQGGIFGIGSRLQKRLYGFQETYYTYMQYVNYMCRSMAVFLTLTDGSDVTGFPDGTFVNTENGMQFKEFTTMNWQNYRMLSDTVVLKPWDYLLSILGSTAFGAISSTGRNIIDSLKDTIIPVDYWFGERSVTLEDGSIITASLNWDESVYGGVDENGKQYTKDNYQSNPKWISARDQSFADYLKGIWSTSFANIGASWMNAVDTNMGQKIRDKVSSVQFMVNPVSFQEEMTNTTEQSIMETTADDIRNNIGSELQWILNSYADDSVIMSLLDTAGSVTETALQAIGNMVQPAVGGLVTNIFSGAISSIKGQKMIYPEIYKRSDSQMSYNFTINLTTPYGDIYNYYMNIIVPYMHLLALAAPRLLTANTVDSPFLVQAYIPGMMTCHLGIISNMNIVKNPNGNRVSVNGFPLDITVSFTIKELYNAFAISPANDPASFLYNETLNDYMSNMAGLYPSINTYLEQQVSAFENFNTYYHDDQAMLNDIADVMVSKIENKINPFTGR